MPGSEIYLESDMGFHFDIVQKEFNLASQALESRVAFGDCRYICIKTTHWNRISWPLSTGGLYCAGSRMSRK